MRSNMGEDTLKDDIGATRGQLTDSDLPVTESMEEGLVIPRKKGEDINSDNEARYYCVDSGAQDAVSFIDNNGLVTFWNW